ncbi:hypothetical protein NDU88_004169 [Pleurodeles waltl]|uniref:Uncharacterized protein n=1 Tax=Pleurodeles waltl TaxID=8319 RepID=A0AAV7V0G4_PLEWA|nr:hypothetical protein NDU88_004169 [Pleurodeles waltl]
MHVHTQARCSTGHCALLQRPRCLPCTLRPGAARDTAPSYSAHAVYRAHSGQVQHGTRRPLTAPTLFIVHTQARCSTGWCILLQRPRCLPRTCTPRAGAARDTAPSYSAHAVYRAHSGQVHHGTLRPLTAPTLCTMHVHTQARCSTGHCALLQRPRCLQCTCTLRAGAARDTAPSYSAHAVYHARAHRGQVQHGTLRPLTALTLFTVHTQARCITGHCALLQRPRCVPCTCILRPGAARDTAPSYSAHAVYHARAYSGQVQHGTLRPLTAPTLFTTHVHTEGRCSTGHCALLQRSRCLPCTCTPRAGAARDTAPSYSAHAVYHARAHRGQVQHGTLRPLTAPTLFTMHVHTQARCSTGHCALLQRPRCVTCTCILRPGAAQDGANSYRAHAVYHARAHRGQVQHGTLRPLTAPTLFTVHTEGRCITGHGALLQRPRCLPCMCTPRPGASRDTAPSYSTHAVYHARAHRGQVHHGTRRLLTAPTLFTMHVHTQAKCSTGHCALLQRPRCLPCTCTPRAGATRDTAPSYSAHAVYHARAHRGQVQHGTLRPLTAPTLFTMHVHTEGHARAHRGQVQHGTLRPLTAPTLFTMHVHTQARCSTGHCALLQRPRCVTCTCILRPGAARDTAPSYSAHAVYHARAYSGQVQHGTLRPLTAPTLFTMHVHTEGRCSTGHCALLQRPRCLPCTCILRPGAARDTAPSYSAHAVYHARAHRGQVQHGTLRPLTALTLFTMHVHTEGRCSTGHCALLQRPRCLPCTCTPRAGAARDTAPSYSAHAVHHARAHRGQVQHGTLRPLTAPTLFTMHVHTQARCSTGWCILLQRSRCLPCTCILRPGAARDTTPSYSAHAVYHARAH